MKYGVEIPEVHRVLVEVELPEGATRKQIADAAGKMLNYGEIDPIDLEYSHTLEEDEWTIRTENGDIVS